jgi:uncharacterized membrane protein YdbT with pleckstrin-like domain
MIKELLNIFRDSPNSFEGQRPDEQVMTLLRNHPFTIIIKIILCLLAGLIPIVLGSVAVSLLPGLVRFDLWFFLIGCWYLLLWLAIFYALTIYTLDTVIITNQRIIDNFQRGLFNREVSELNNHRIQDVSVHTSGLIETILEFGTVTVQTAAAEKQFIFRNLPRPEKVKDTIMKMAELARSDVTVSM